MTKAHGAAFVALAALLLVTTGASAYCLGRTCNPTKEPCETDADDCVTTGAILHWPADCVTFDIQLDGSPKSDLSAADVSEVVERAFKPWLRAECGNGNPSIKVGTYGPVTCDESRFNKTGRNANIVMFREDRWPYPGQIDTYGLTMLRYDIHTGELWDADVEINTADFDVGVGSEDDRVDLQSILTHELGHFLGLSHPAADQVDATMSADWDGVGTSLRSLDTDDVAGICALYPPDRATKRSCEPINGFSEECFEPASTLPKSPSCAVVARPASTSATASAFALLAVASLRRRGKGARKRAVRAARQRTHNGRARPGGEPTPSAPAEAPRLRLLELLGTPAASFVLRFVAVTALLLLLYAYPYPAGGFVSTCFERYLSGYAGAAGALLKQLDPSVHVAQNLITGRFPLAIVRDCDAMEVNILFVAAVAAFPAPLWRRCAGAVVGLLLLVVANLSRIVSLYFIGVAAPDSFELVHREVWPLVLIATALVLFLVWTRWERSFFHDGSSPAPA